VFLVLFGAVLVIAGGMIPGLSDYVRSIFATVGTAIGLVGPLLVGERLLTFRVKEATAAAAAAGSTAGEALEAARSARDAVANLDEGVREQLSQIRAEDEQQRQDAAEGKQKAFVDLYARAAEHRWIDFRGLRIPTGMGEFWLRVRVAEPTSDGETTRSVELAFEGPKLEPIGEPVEWTSSEEAIHMLRQLALALMPTNLWPGDDVFRRSNLLEAATSAIGKACDLHGGPGRARNVGPIVGFLGDDWAVTSYGLESLQADTYVKRDYLVYQTDQALQRIQASLEDSDLDLGSFAAVFGDAQRVCEGLQREDREKIIRFRL
jgi:hypothetical protein